ncbi:hypothetical protein ACFB49_35440 [Sphingomonas sp. DBB INV C78]
MVEGVPILGLFVLACTLQDIDPHTGAAISEEHAASLVARDGVGTLIGWEGLDGQGNVLVRRFANGEIYLTGMISRETSAEIWAVVKPSKIVRNFEIEWRALDYISEDEPPVAVTWSKGSCEQLAAGGD